MFLLGTPGDLLYDLYMDILVVNMSIQEHLSILKSCIKGCVSPRESHNL